MTSLLTSNTSTNLSFSNQLCLANFPDLNPVATVCCSPGSDPKKVGPISKNDKSLNPLPKFLFKWIIKLEKIELRKTFKSELIGLIILISLLFSMNS